MIIVIICVLVFIISFIINMYNNRKGLMMNYDLEIGMGVGMVFSTVGLVVSIISIIVANATADYAIYQSQIEREGLVKRYEIVQSKYEDFSKSDAIKDIYKWNKKVYSTKYWTENKFTNWFNSKRYADSLEYIDIEE